jgi:hypothetical protein
MSAFDALVKEAAEEASLDPELVRKRARAVGAVSYFHQTKAGWLQPEFQHVYDMRLEPGEARLAPMDGEVESFEVRRFFFFLVCNHGCGDMWWCVQLMSLDEVVTRMHAGDFKPNCALSVSFSMLHAGVMPTYISQSPYRFYGAPGSLDSRE